MRILSIPLALLLTTSLLHADEPARAEPIPLSLELEGKCVNTLRTVLRRIDEQPTNFWPAMHAAEALTLAGHGDELRPLLEPRLPKEMDHQRRCGLARELVRSGYREPLGILFTTLGDTTSNGRVHAAESLYKLNEIGDGQLMRAAFAQTENRKLQLMAAAALARSGEDAALKPLRAALEDQDVEIRKIGAWALGLLGDEQDLVPLRKLVANEADRLAKAYYTNALASLGDGSARKSLGQHLLLSDPAVLAYSSEFAGYSRAVEYRPRLIALLDDANVDVRARAAQALIMFSKPPVPFRAPK